MMHSETTLHEGYPDPHHDIYTKTTFGFWVYLITDFVLFASFFATYAVLVNNTYGGPSIKEIFSLPFVLLQTLILLTCSFTAGLGGAAAHRKNKNVTILLFATTFLLGIVFMAMEISEFSRLLSCDDGWQRSGFLSAYFTLVGFHAIHMLFAILWAIVLIIPVFLEGVTQASIRRLTCLKMFWQFLNIIWVFIFTIVYMGAYD